jgi:hypothetical protein
MSQKIHRAARRHQWLVIDKRTVEDVRLTWAARGLLAYLLSRPDDWEVLVKDLIKRGNLKRDGIYALAPGAARCRLPSLRTDSR